MKHSILPISIIAGMLVSGGALYEAHSTHAQACARMQQQALQAATAPIRPHSTQQLGFTPMDQFAKVYVPQCPPEDDDAATFSSIVAGIIVGLACFFLGSLFSRSNRSNHMEHL